MTAAALLLAAALLVGTGPRNDRWAGVSAWPARRIRTEKAPRRDLFAAASTFDVLAVCLSAGMTVPAATAAAAASAPPELRAMLQRAGDLMRLGADPESAWQGAGDRADPSCEALARLARRSAASGAALASGLAGLAEQSRQEVTHAAAAAAERAGVLIAGPLGLCFLPAFVCLGIVPVVAGLAGEIFGAGLL